MIQNDASDAILVFFSRRGNCAGGRDPSGDAINNSSLFLFCFAQTLFRQKEVAVPCAILRCRRCNALRLGVSRQAGIRCLSQESHGIELPFSDLDSPKAAIVDVVKNEFLFVGNFARAATTQLAFVLIGIVVAVSLFVNPRIEKSSNKPKSPNLFTATTDEIKISFRLFYQSFETVMGAQIRISAINTLLTAVFVLVVSLKYGTFVVGLTFLCGLLPIVGNLISNAVIVGIAITMSPRLAIVALIFLVAVHKLEYFLNSKIIGDLIKNPVWLTLLALIIGERFMGIPGMILAPVVLNYIKVEAFKWPAPDSIPADERN